MNQNELKRKIEALEQRIAALEQMLYWHANMNQKQSTTPSGGDTIWTGPWQMVSSGSTAQL